MRYTLFLVILFVIELVALCLSTHAIGQQVVSIKGRLSKGFTGKELLLYKYKSAFDHELISKINVTNQAFTINKELEEADAYLLENPSENTFFLFIWDGNLTVDLTGSKFYEPVITGSPLTTELFHFNQANQDKHFRPIRKIDSLITHTKDKAILDSLRQVRRELMDWSRSASEAFRLKYSHDRSDSFISLLLLTYTGDKFPMTAEYQAAFEGLSEGLKKHSRAKYFRDR